MTPIGVPPPVSTGSDASGGRLTAGTEPAGPVNLRETIAAPSTISGGPPALFVLVYGPIGESGFPSLTPREATPEEVLSQPVVKAALAAAERRGTP